jgi:hypothetical protein
MGLLHRKHKPEPILRVVTTVNSEPEAAMVCDLLSQAGIGAIQKLSSGVGGAWSGAGARDVYVEEHDLDRAQEVLNVENRE